MFPQIKFLPVVYSSIIPAYGKKVEGYYNFVATEKVCARQKEVGDTFPIQHIYSIYS